MTEETNGEFDIAPEDAVVADAPVEEANPYLDMFKTEGIMDMNGNMVTEQLFPGAVVRPIAPKDKESAPRYIVEWNPKKDTGKPRYHDEAWFTVGDDLTPRLPAHLAEQFEAVCADVKPFMESGLKISTELATMSHAAELVREALVLVERGKLGSADKIDDEFGMLCKLSHVVVAGAEVSMLQAKFEYVRTVIDVAFNKFLFDVQLWLGCMLPLEIRQHPSQPGGQDSELQLDITVTVATLPMTSDDQEEQRWYCTNDVMLHDPQLYFALFPDQHTGTNVKKIAKAVHGPTVFKDSFEANKAAMIKSGDLVLMPD